MSHLFKEVHSFASGEEAIAQTPYMQPPQIILIDIGLPGIDGIETMKNLLEVWPVSRMLIFTIYEDDDHVFEALKCGASDIFSKVNLLKTS
ncbi:MAG: response regulator transcription factor [Saprospiraceae bacterium]|nr:response regulator transcription factor [Saprospiraceae bacterium]